MLLKLVNLELEWEVSAGQVEQCRIRSEEISGALITIINMALRAS